MTFEIARFHLLNDPPFVRRTCLLNKWGFCYWRFTAMYEAFY